MEPTSRRGAQSAPTPVRESGRGRRLIVGISGASGSTLAVRFLATAARHEAVERIHLVVSNSALRVSASELDPPAST
ncbi:MAG TPA: hypothetical protein VHL58_18555, partial [Thermoanaerobaculia bacterium]|nr:hypothetical protein [Thermoanaerobaculia bacterium]